MFLDCLYSLLPTTPGRVLRVLNKALMGIMGGEKPMPYICGPGRPWAKYCLLYHFLGLCFPLDSRLSRVLLTNRVQPPWILVQPPWIRRTWAQNYPPLFWARDQNPDILVMPRWWELVVGSRFPWFNGDISKQRISMGFMQRKWVRGEKKAKATKLHPWKLTWHWKIPILNRKYIFKSWIFHCHVSFRGVSPIFLVEHHMMDGEFVSKLCGPDHLTSLVLGSWSNLSEPKKRVKLRLVLLLPTRISMNFKVTGMLNHWVKSQQYTNTVYNFWPWHRWFWKFPIIS